MSASQSAAQLLLALGGAALLVSALGLWILPDALTRQHAATKSVTLGLTLLALGAVLHELDTGWAIRLVVLQVFLFASVPMASQALAQSALRESGRESSARDAPRIGD